MQIFRRFIDFSKSSGQSGQSLVQILIVVGLSGIVLAAIASMVLTLTRQQAQATLTEQASTIRNSLGLLINAANSWKQTYTSTKNNFASGSSLDCLIVPGKPCTVGEAVDLPGGTAISNYPINAVLDAAGNAYYDATNPSAGFTQQGAPCLTFSSAGNDACPLRFNITWSAICATLPAPGTCVNPQVQVSITAVYKPLTQRLAFNPANYSIPAFIQGTLGNPSCWQYTGGNLIDTCPGNVGVGTSTPASKFDIEVPGAFNYMDVNGTVWIGTNTPVAVPGPTAMTTGGGNPSSQPLNVNGGISTVNANGGLGLLSAVTGVSGFVASQPAIVAYSALGTYPGNPAISADSEVGPAIEVSNLTHNGFVTAPVAQNGVWMGTAFNSGAVPVWNTQYTQGAVAGAVTNGFYVRYYNSTTPAVIPPHGLAVPIFQYGLTLLASNGNLGVHTGAPAYPLDVVGDIQTSTCLHYYSSVLGTCSSDERLKRDIKPYELGLKELIGIKPVTFKYNGLGGNLDDGKTQLGVIAQQVEKVVPQLVGTKETKLRPDDKTSTVTKTVDYGAFTYMIINAVKTLYTHMTGLDRDLASLKADKADKTTVDALKAENEKLKQDALERSNEIAELTAYLCAKDSAAKFCVR